MLTSKTASKPSRILPGDEYDHFGGTGIAPQERKISKTKKSKKRKNSKKGSTPLGNNNDAFSYGFGASSGLSSTGELVNPFGDTVSDFDIEVSWDALSNLSQNKRVTMNEFTVWINTYLQLNWDESRIKRAWAALDQDKAKYITFREFRSGLKSTNSDVILFYSNLMQRSDVHPMKGDKSDWESVSAPGRIKRMREFSPRYLRTFSRKKGNQEKSFNEISEFLTKWRKFSLDFLHSSYWKPLAESNKNYVGIVGNLWQKMCNMMGVISSSYGGSDGKYGVITYEFFVLLSRLCQHQPFIAYYGYKHMTMTFLLNLNTYDVEDSNCLGKIAWVSGAMQCMVRSASRPTMSLNICNYFVDLLLVKLGAQKESKVSSGGDKETDKELNSMKAPKVWNECCKYQFLWSLCAAIDCTESVTKSIRDLKKEGGSHLIKKLSLVCIAIFTRTENAAFVDILRIGYKLLSRIDCMDSTEHDKVLKQMSSDQRKKYNRNFGQSRIVRFTSAAAGASGAQQTTKQYASTPVAPSEQYTQKYRIGSLGASVAMNKIKKGSSSSGKSRIIDVNSYDKLQNPFEFKLFAHDIICAFRYADVNQDNAISFTDFTQSLMKVGVIRDDEEAKEMWLILNPSSHSRGINFEKFSSVLESYPRSLHNWLCRIVSCNHLARQPFKSDLDSKRIKKVLKDQRKLTWKERIDALHCVSRLFARSSSSKKEFQNKFKSFLPRLLEHLKDPHPLVVRASCVTLTKIMIYKNGSMTKYTQKIMDVLTANFATKKDEITTESCFGCFANLVRHVPDNKKFATLSHILKLVIFKNVCVRCFGWRIAAITFERILGLKKARPNSWWNIAENILKAGRSEKSKIVQKESIRLLFIFQNSAKHYAYIEQYIQFFPVPNNMEQLKVNIVADIQQRMDEYAEEAAAQADAMDVYSLISTEQEFNTKEEQKQDAVSSAGGAPAPFDFVDDIIKSTEDREQDLNRGLGRRLILHRINRDDSEIRKVYSLYNIGSQLNNTRTLLASLKYLGFTMSRGELTLILSEIKMLIPDDAFTMDKYAFFVKHCYATLDCAWSTYLNSAMDVESAMDVDISNIENPKSEFDSSLAQLRTLCAPDNDDNSNSNLQKKCHILCDIYNLFVTPQVENDDVLFEEMMEAMNPIILAQIADNLHSTIWIQEICILICRIAQFHISRFAEYGAAYYDMFFQICAYCSSIVQHACHKTCLVIASMVSFLNSPNAKDMTQSLCSHVSSSNDSIIFKCLLAECLINVPLKRDEQIRTEVIYALWNSMKSTVYESTNSVAINIVAYMHSATYLKLGNVPNNCDISAIQRAQKEESWNHMLRADIEANETGPFNDLAMEHGWDHLKYYSDDFNARMQLLEQWYELESLSNNPIGMAAVTQLIKALNHTQYKAKQTQKKVDPTHAAELEENTQQEETLEAQQQPQEEEQPLQTTKDTVFSSLTAQYLAQQRQQNQRTQQT